MNTHNLVIYELDELYKIFEEIKKDINFNFEKINKQELLNLKSNSNCLILTKKEIPELDNQIKESMLNKSKTRLIALRAIKSAILLEEKSGGSIEKNPVKLLMKLIKQRKDSRDLYQKENRIDLAEKESNEIKIIEEFLPEQMSDVDLEKKIGEIIKEEGGASMKDMGRIMGIAVKMLDGKADNSRVSIFVKKLLA